MSNTDKLLTALIEETDVSDIKCKSRMDELLKRCCCGETCSDIEPRSNTEKLLKQLNEKMINGDGGGSASVLIPGQEGGTVVPNTGFVEKVYFNTDLSDEEVREILNTLTYNDGIDYILVAGTIEAPTALLGIISEGGVYLIADMLTYQMYWVDELIALDMGTTAGWQTFNNPIEINAEVIADIDGTVIGAQNDKLSNLFSPTPFVETEATTINLLGTYDGTTISQDVVANPDIDIVGLLDQQKLPTKIKASIKKQSKEATPTESEQVIEPDENCLLSQVQVNAIPSEYIKVSGTKQIIYGTDLDNDVSAYKQADVITLQRIVNMRGGYYLFKHQTQSTIEQWCAYLATSVEPSYIFAESQLTSIPNNIKFKGTVYEGMFKDCETITKIELDLSNATIMREFCYGCTALTEVVLNNANNVTDIVHAFYGCTALTNLTKLDLFNVNQSFYIAPFSNCKNLTNLEISNIKYNLQVGSGTTWGHLLTNESLIGLCQECINVGSSRTLTVGSANLDKLASVYVKLTGEAEEDESYPKLPMVQCESTDEGAMLIEDYMTSKGWVLA